jgi:putative SOS response-associated peptidase YedK
VHYAPQFEPIALAGIWTSGEHRGEPRRTFAILTRAATPELARVHDRMPAVLAPEHYAAWLARDTSRDDLQRLLEQVPAKIETRPVSTYVNKPANDGPDCIAPCSGAVTAGEGSV